MKFRRISTGIGIKNAWVMPNICILDGIIESVSARTPATRAT
jgi:hypothetical protein